MHRRLCCKHWMSGHVLGRMLREFNRGINGRIELLFLQQCSRGSIENLCSFRGASKFIMRSSYLVGAPNTYYTAFHKSLAEQPQASGETIAGKISAEDNDYTIYTCIRASRLAQLQEQFNRLIRAFLRKERLVAPLHPEVLHSFYDPEPVVYLKIYLDRFAAANNIGPAIVAEFFRWVQTELFAGVWFHGGREGIADRLRGLAIYAPRSFDEGAGISIWIYTKTVCCRIYGGSFRRSQSASVLTRFRWVLSLKQ
jgi:hypothetical protein